MQLIAGLGNPGAEYIHNRHNVGFLWLDFLAQKLTDQPQFSKDGKYNALICDVTDKKLGRIILFKPQTYMNSSGIALKKIIEFLKIQTDNMTIAHDDLDIQFGEFKIQKGKGPKVHNGLKSVEENLETADFLRVRIGIDSRPEGHKIAGKGYVLDNFTDEELEQLQAKIFPSIYKELYGHN
jgi:PTH1 family peptidyl-tRNA hydrolase